MGQRHETINFGGQQVKGKAKIGNKNPFRRDISRTVRQILTKPGRNILW